MCLGSLAFVPEGPQLAWKPAESISSHVRSLAQVWSLAQETSAQGSRPRASEARLSLVREKCASYLTCEGCGLGSFHYFPSLKLVGLL